MKKPLTIILSLMMALILTTCSSNEGEEVIICVDTNVYVALGSDELDLEALDLPLNDLTYVSIEIDEDKSDYDLSVAGEYTLVVILTDEDGDTTEVSLTLVVEEEVEETEEVITTDIEVLLAKFSSKEDTITAIASLVDVDSELIIAATTNALATLSGSSSSSTTTNDNSSSTVSSGSSNSKTETTTSSNAEDIAALQQAVDDAQAVIDKGSLGFFETYSYSNAVKYLNNSNSWTTSAHYARTSIGSSSDATSLKNMKSAIEMIIQGNELRESEGVSALKISSTLMAISQVNTNASAYTLAHTSKGNVSENLAWGYTNPYSGWYTTEKKVYNWLDDNGYSVTLSNSSSVISKLSDDIKNRIVEECGLSSTGFIQVGHYLNLISTSYSATGGAYNQYGSYGRTHGQVFTSSISDAEDANAYYTKFMAYYNSVYKALEDAEDALKAALS